MTALPDGQYAFARTKHALTAYRAPDSHSGIAMFLKENVHVEILDQVYGTDSQVWTHVRSLGGTEGYIPDMDLIHLSPEQADLYQLVPYALPDPDEPDSDWGRIVRRTGLRSGTYDADSTLIQMLDAGDTLRLIARLDGDDADLWYLVQGTDGTVGYVRTSAVRKISRQEGEALFSTPSVPASSPSAVYTGTAQIISEDAWLFSIPSEKGVRIQKCSQGQNVTVLGQTAGDDEWIWHEVSVQGQKGYIRADMLTMIPVTIVPFATAAGAISEPFAVWATPVRKDTPAVTAATFPSPSADPSPTPAVSPVVTAPAVDVQPDPGNPENVQTDIRRILIPALLGLLMIGIGIGALNARRRKKRAEAARRAGIRNRRPAGSAFRNNTKDSDEDP